MLAYPPRAESRTRDLVDFEQSIAAMTLAFDSVRDPDVEYAQFPPLVRTFDLLVDASHPPTQDMFATAVADQLPHLPRRAVMARARRAYPSLIRQEHFRRLLRLEFDVVLADPYVDYCGIDLLVIERGRALGIALSTDTRTAGRWREVKTRRKLPIADVPTLDLLAGPGAYEVGPFWLHPPGQLNDVHAFVDRHLALTGREN